ncbi:MAG: hypothetical protein RLZZ324_261 [Candidatus Parcubacteria bacterium]|jgi:hypothetical protein
MKRKPAKSAMPRKARAKRAVGVAKKVTPAKAKKRGAGARGAVPEAMIVTKFASPHLRRFAAPIITRHPSVPASFDSAATVPAIHDAAPESAPHQELVQRVPAAIRSPWHAVIAFFVLAFVGVGVAAALIRTVDAATFQGPTAAAPGGNIPVTIWNRGATAAQQTNAGIDIDGNGGASFKGFSVGTAALVISGAQNLMYGNVDTTSTGNLLLLQNESADMFKVTARGDVKAAGCFGATFVGVTPSSFHGSLGAVGSYYGADNKCSTAYAGSHVCKPEEILESISCSVAGDPIRTNGGISAWLDGGPPGFTANANDCIGWTDNTAGAYGRVWQFNNVTGGSGTMTTCNAGGGLKYACCR